MLSPVNAPLNLVWWFLLRRYPGRVPLRSSGVVVPTGSRIIGVLALIWGVVFAIAAILAAGEGIWEITPLFFTWSYVTLAMRAAYLTAARQWSALRSL